MKSIDTLQGVRNRIAVAKLDPDKPFGIHRPQRDGDIGWDLEAMDTVVIPPGESRDVPVNARIALPEGFYADIRNRSSMARRNLYVDQNVIDTGYRGPLFVFIRNMNPMVNPITFQWARDPQMFEEAARRDMEAGAVEITAGSRIGQLIFSHVHPVWLDESEVALDTDRGENGMGSTGT